MRVPVVPAGVARFVGVSVARIITREGSDTLILIRSQRPVAYLIGRELSQKEAGPSVSGAGMAVPTPFGLRVQSPTTRVPHV